MEFGGWAQADFDIFRIPGFEERMALIRAHVQPKLDALGRDLTPLLENETGGEWFYHVAKHMRRSVHPPSDTWVAFNRVKKGYKATTHFDVGLSALGANVAVVVKPECTERDVFAGGLERNAEALSRLYANDRNLFVGNVPNAALDEMLAASKAKPEDWRNRAWSLRHRKQYEFEAGYRLEAVEAVRLSGEDFVRLALERLRALLPLYMGGVEPDYVLAEDAEPRARRRSAKTASRPLTPV